MQKMTLEYDEETNKLLEELKIFFGVRTKTAVIRRALAIARMAKRVSNEEGVVQFGNPSNPQIVQNFSLSA